MKFQRIQDGVGDFLDFDSSILYMELVSELGNPGNPQKWYINTSLNYIEVCIKDENLDTSGIAEIITTHGSEAQILIRNKNVKKKKTDSNVINKIREAYSIDDEFKMLRLSISNPNDPDFIEYNNFVESKVKQGRVIKSDIDKRRNISTLKNVSITIK